MGLSVARVWLCAAAVGMACGGAPRGAITGRYAGTWDGRWYRTTEDTGIAWRAVMSVAQDGALVGSLTLAIGGPAVPLTTLQVTESTLVQRIGPYFIPSLDAPVTTQLRGHLGGDSLFGTYTTVAHSDEGATLGTFVARRRPAPAP